VILNITGTRQTPSIKTELDTYDNTSKSWTKRQSGNEESDALSFIISGQFSSEITGSSAPAFSEQTWDSVWQPT